MDLVGDHYVTPVAFAKVNAAFIAPVTYDLKMLVSFSREGDVCGSEIDTKDSPTFAA
jgi:hypothetical protein